MGYRFPYFRCFRPGRHLVPHRLLQPDGRYCRSAALYHLFQADQSGLRRGKRIVIEKYIKKQPVCKRLHSVRRMPVLQTGLFSLFHLIACGWTPVPGALREIFYAGGRFFLPVYQTEALRIPPQYPAPAGV